MSDKLAQQVPAADFTSQGQKLFVDVQIMKQGACSAAPPSGGSLRPQMGFRARQVSSLITPCTHDRTAAASVAGSDSLACSTMVEPGKRCVSLPVIASNRGAWRNRRSSDAPSRKTLVLTSLGQDHSSGPIAVRYFAALVFGPDVEFHQCIIHLSCISW